MLCYNLFRKVDLKVSVISTYIKLLELNLFFQTNKIKFYSLWNCIIIINYYFVISKYWMLIRCFFICYFVVKGHNSSHQIIPIDFLQIVFFFLLWYITKLFNNIIDFRSNYLLLSSRIIDIKPTKIKKNLLII